MKTDRNHTDPSCPYLGVDLSSRYAREPRPIDVCGLHVNAAGGFDASFWQWYWDAPTEEPDLTDILAELRAARSVMVDGPQALAGKGRQVRACERACRAPGRTPDRVPAADVPYGTFIRSAVEWFDALDRAGIAVSPAGAVGGVNEFYPAAAWFRLAGQRRLPVKTSAVGRRVRLDLLRRHGVRFPRRLSPSHDALDACLGAFLAAIADHRVAGMSLETCGLPLRRDRDGLREGPILLPRLLSNAIRNTL